MKRFEDLIRSLDRIRNPKTLDDYIHLITMLVPIGRVVSYSALAKVCGTHPRRVALAMKRNDLAPIVPCHRVVRLDGSLAGYTPGGIDIKKRLLEVEGIEVLGDHVPRTYFYDRDLILLVGNDNRL